ncbi:salicylate synthase [Streptomyces sp. NPDC058067]|uniref:salicylate synthase n=1 Tax=Streptomyces sp. NPDC058067 TaxID=3346324 RepID=UPI0036E6ABB0
MTSRPCYRETEADAPHDPLLTVAALAAAHRDETHFVYEHADTWTFCAGTLAELTVDAHHVHYVCGSERRSVAWRDQPLRTVAELLDILPMRSWRAYGWAAFELARFARTGGEPLPAARSPHGTRRPLLKLVVPRDEIRITAGRALLSCADEARPAELAALLEELPVRREPASGTVELDLAVTGGQYRERVGEAVAEIASGLLDKVVLSRVVPVPHEIDLIDSFVLGRRHNTPARSFLLHMDGMRAAGFSPEVVLSVSADGRVRTQPLAGTRALTPSAVENRRLRAELLGDAKEIHEHEISVTAALEEMRTVCEDAGVGVDEYMAVKERGSVQHLASEVSGRLAPGRDRWDAFAALFPAITASGVPKSVAVEAIRRHEQEARGMYGGAVLTLDSNGSLDAALVLRAVFAQAGRVWLRAGAGVVRDSVPARELEETCEKLRSVATYLVPAQALAEVP